MIEYKETRHTLQQKQISDLSLYSAGYEACAPGHHYGPIYRSYQLVHFILSGKGVLEIDGHIFQLGAGDAFLIPSGKIAYYAADKTDPWCYTWINFLGINSQMYTYQLIASAPEPYVLHGLNTEKYRTLIGQVLALEGTATARYFKGNSILLQVLGELFQDAGFDERYWGKNSVADEAKFYLDVNYSEKLKLKEVARNFGVHPNYLTRVFHEKYHVTPKQYLLNLKLQKAPPICPLPSLPGPWALMTEWPSPSCSKRPTDVPPASIAIGKKRSHKKRTFIIPSCMLCMRSATSSVPDRLPAFPHISHAGQDIQRTFICCARKNTVYLN